MIYYHRFLRCKQDKCVIFCKCLPFAGFLGETMFKRKHFYNPLEMELKDAEHLFGIPFICGYEWNGVDSNYLVEGSSRLPSRERALFKYTISGGGELLLNGKEKHLLKPGDAFLLSGAVNTAGYRYRIAPGYDHWEFLFISYHKSAAVEIVKKIVADCGTNVVQLDPAGEAMSHAWHIYDLFQSGEIADRYAASSLGYDFLMHLCSESLSFCGKSHGSDLVHKISAYCFRNLSSPITVDELADLCGYSRWHFSKIFRQAAGMTPSEFIMEQKLTAALQLLHQENIPVKELAMRCGFNDPGYFGRRFKRKFGVTPIHFERIDHI